jgi:acetyl-CoA carboxylase carboxyltransferase component
MPMKDMLDELGRRRQAARAMGGADRIERQHQRGKLTVRQRIDLLFDDGSFEEYGLLASHLGQRPGQPTTPADGVVTGFGRIDGRHAGVIAEDFTVLGGSTGIINLKKRVRMNGHTVGIVANQPTVLAGAITTSAAQKQRHFIDLCTAYHVPLIFLVDVPGVMTGPQSEKEGALRAGMAVAHSLAWADVPKLVVVIRKAFGFGGCAMCGYGGGQTLTLAWPSVDFSSIPPDAAVQAAHGSEIDASDDPGALRKKFMEKYERFSGAYPAAASFNLDDVIDPRETRPRLIRALELALGRRSEPASPAMRHGVMP